MLDLLFSQLGINEASNKIEDLRRELAFTPGSGMDAALAHIADRAVKIAALNTHEATGTLKMSHVSTRVEDGYSVHSDYKFINPIEGIPAALYALEEHSRGGDHAFYEIVEEEHGSVLLEIGADLLISHLEAA